MIVHLLTSAASRLLRLYGCCYFVGAIQVTFNYLEVYNENIRDLLSPDSVYLDLREDPVKVRLHPLFHTLHPLFHNFSTTTGRVSPKISSGVEIANDGILCRNGYGRTSLSALLGKCALVVDSIRSK